MGHGNRWGRLGCIGALAVLVAAQSAPAQEDEGPNQGRLSFSVASEITNAYFFRGILNERDGFIWQPYANLGLNLYEGQGTVSSVDLGFGTWFSFQTEKTLATGDGPSSLYEADYYPSVNVTFADIVETSLSYILYTSPNGAFSTVQQLDLVLSLDDSQRLGAFALNPSTTFSFELENTSFGNDEGGYFELALEPGTELGSGDHPLSLSLPLKVGLSMYDYYETNKDHTFGFFSFGLTGSMVLAFIPEDYGFWSTGVSITALVLSHTLENANQGVGIYPVAVWNLGFEY